ncbi:hypothetical protein ACLOJK_004761, partial [Asimina triloba]
MPSGCTLLISLRSRMPCLKWIRCCPGGFAVWIWGGQSSTAGSLDDGAELHGSSK